jgi:hypothetical protein
MMRFHYRVTVMGSISDFCLNSRGVQFFGVATIHCSGCWYEFFGGGGSVIFTGKICSSWGPCLDVI